MATTSIWAVKGWLGKVVLYIENPDKTDNPKFYRQEELTDVQTQSLSDVMDYAVRAEKTTVTPDDESAMVVRQFISGINCLPSTARDEMLAVKKRFGKEDGVIAYHGYQSFAPGEATPELAHEIGVKLAQRLWGERYQVLVATHLDKENHLHNHFVLNTVSFVDGIKYHRTEKDYHDMRTVSDTLCREYNLSVIQRPQAGKSKHYGEWRAEQEQRPTWRGLIRSEIDELIRQSVTEKQFYYLLRQKGYEVKFGKDISVRPPGKERFVRLTRNFGEAYTAEAIRQRTLMQSVIEDEQPPGNAIIAHNEGVDLLPSNIELSGMETGLFNVMSREYVLKSCIEGMRKNYDYILIDCMPSLGMMTVNALAAADSVIIPSQPNFLSTKGLNLLLRSIAKIKRQINPRLRIDGILLTMVDNRTNNAKSIITSLRSSVGENIRVFESEIPFSVRAAECSLSGESIFSHDKNGKVAAVYEALTKEVTEIEERAKNRPGPDWIR